MKDNRELQPIYLDNPIRNSEDDVLGRMSIARSFVGNVLRLDVSDGATVGVFGAWGSGKTSFINLVGHEFKQREIPVLNFNPWMFSGPEQLVQRFFTELSAEMGETKGLEKVGQALSKYGDALNTVTTVLSTILGMPQVGKLAADLLGAAATNQGKSESPQELREKVKNTLRQRDKPIMVVLDDIDRLSVSEIRDVFKLVRLTASFPKLVYIVVCDRIQVEKALDEHGLPGHLYLEKILQLPFDLPEVPNQRLEEQLGDALDAALNGIEDRGPFDRQAWEEVYWEIIRPLVWNMRDVRRYAAAIQVTLVDLGGQVALADVLGLEAVRMFLPDVFRLLPGAVDALTVTSVGQQNTRHIRTQTRKRAGISTEPDVRFKGQVDELIKTGKTHDAEVRAMIVRLFPVGRRYMPGAGAHHDVGNDDSPYGDEWAAKRLQERRVVHEHILRVYLERIVGGDLSALHDAEQALDLMANSTALDQFLRSLNLDRFLAVLDHLRTFNGRFIPDHVAFGTIVLLNLLAEMPKQSGGSIRDEPQMFVGLVVVTLFEALEGPDAIEATMGRVLPAIESLSSKVLLVDRIRHPHRDARSLVTKAAATRFETQLRDEISSASVDDLAKERDLLRVLGFAKGVTDPADEPFDIPDSPQLSFILLRSYDIRTLAFLYGDEATLKSRVEGLNAQFENLKPWIEGLGIPHDEAERVLASANDALNK